MGVSGERESKSIWAAIAIGLLSVACLLACLVSASFRSAGASAAKQAQILYSKQRNMQRQLGELQAEIRSLKSPSDLGERLGSMSGAKKMRVASTVSKNDPKKKKSSPKPIRTKAPKPTTVAMGRG